jgi:hypothetical protein
VNFKNTTVEAKKVARRYAWKEGRKGRKEGGVLRKGREGKGRKERKGGRRGDGRKEREWKGGREGGRKEGRTEGRTDGRKGRKRRKE